MQDYKLAINKDKDLLLQVIKKIAQLHELNTEVVNKLIYTNPSKSVGIFSKSTLLYAFREFEKKGNLDLDSAEKSNFLSAVRMKKIRTLSGVTPVTVLTKPYYCPGNCIFCPKDVKMPKSYLSSEPGAQRALTNKFDPYLQVYNRLFAYYSIGHPTDKVELIVLGGTWSSYDEEYQRFFIKRCFDAMNDFNTKENPQNISTEYFDTEVYDFTWDDIFQVQRLNEKAQSRCVGLVLETRPDCIDEKEVEKIRKFGGTKVQIGVQSLDDGILELNKRGHSVLCTKKAFEILRLAGFKIHAHWMPNLYGSNPRKDVRDYKKLFSKNFSPDELKIYPCSLLETAELMNYYKKGLWKPYTEEELLYVLKRVLIMTPRYNRITRVVRDISSEDIVAGNKKSNFRQIVQKHLEKEGKKPVEIRSREIRGKNPRFSKISLKITKYKTTVSKEYFLEYVTENDEILGFLRLSLPLKPSFIEEIKNSALIREVHVYGQSLEIEENEKEIAGNRPVQHRGIGKNLIKTSIDIAQKKGYKKLSVISSVGTREYYRKRGFSDGFLYQHMDLS